MLSCAAHFDGSLAGVDFMPAIQVLDEAGQVAATVVGPKVSAGGSADVTFAPFLENPDTGGATGGGIQFDTFPQAGDWLYVETDNDAGSPNGFGTQFVDTTTGGMEFETADAELALGQTSGLGIGAFLSSSTGIEIRGHGTGAVKIRNTDTDGITIEDAATSSGQGVKVLSDNGPIFIDAKETLGMFAEKNPATLASSHTTPGLGMYMELDNLSFILYLKGGTRIMQIDFDGVNWNYHIQAGSAWVADL